MTTKPGKRDWAKRIAIKITTLYAKHAHETGCRGDCLEVWIARALRRARQLKEAERKGAEKRGWQARQKYDENVRMGRVKP